MTPFEYIKDVTSPFSLIAFIVSVVLYFWYRSNAQRDIMLVKSAPENDRTRLISILFKKYHIDKSKLKSEDVLKIISRQITERTKIIKFCVVAAVLVILLWPIVFNKSSYTSIKVHVEGVVGAKHINLKEGELSINATESGTQKMKLNSDGDVYFQNLHIGEIVRFTFHHSEPYMPVYKDTSYVVAVNSQIFFPVSLQGVDKIKGIVLFQDSPLSGVLVRFDTISTLTSSGGYFNMNVPLDQQDEQYEVSFDKAGFKFKTRTAHPSQGDMQVKLEKKDL